ncbi:MAG: dockerin type I domain-containing protein [Planctomycetota bacterium]
MRQSKNRSLNGGSRHQRTGRARILRFDRLEDRRLMAGLDVFVFDDPISSRQLSNGSSPAAEKIVYVDLNADGLQEANEPLGVTDKNGLVRFSDLQPGSYLIRLLGQNRTLAQTTQTTAAPTGSWLSNLDIQQNLTWESDTVGWFATSTRLIRLDIERGMAQDSLPLGGPILSVAMKDASTGVALVGTNASSRLIQFDLRSLTSNASPESLPGASQILRIGDALMVRRTTARGQGLYGIQIELGSNGFVLSQNRDPWVDGLSASATVNALGSQGLIVVDAANFDAASFDALNGGYRVTTYQRSVGGLEIAAQRDFSGRVKFSSASPDGTQFAIEGDGGFQVISTSSGLPILAILPNAAGPSSFDGTRGLFLTASKSNASRMLGWSVADWSQQLDVLVADTFTREQTDRTVWQMGFLNDTLIGIRDGGVYRHALNVANAASAVLSESVISQVAIGIRNRGSNAKPTLTAAKQLNTFEDTPFVVSDNFLQGLSGDANGDRVYYVLRNAPALGKLNWSTTSGGVYAPIANTNGADQFVIQAYDGRDWSAPQTFGIQIAPVNDLPVRIDIPKSIDVQENGTGTILSSIRVIDPDSDSNYRYVVSDGRFIVQNGQLILSPGISLDYEAQRTILLTIAATDIKSNDFISQTVTINVSDRNDPPTGIVITGNGQVPEKRPSYVVGNVNVMDQDVGEVYDITVSDNRFEVVGNVVRVKAGSGLTYVDPGWVDLTFTAKSKSNGTTIQRSDRLYVLKDTTPYHNDVLPEDVDGDGKVTPLDPLIIVNYINSHGPGYLPSNGEGEAIGNLDVDGDGKVSPLDILIIINQLNHQSVTPAGGGRSNSSGSGLAAEGESNRDPVSSSRLSVPVQPKIAPPQIKSPLSVPTPPPTGPNAINPTLSVPSLRAIPETKLNKRVDRTSNKRR